MSEVSNLPEGFNNVLVGYFWRTFDEQNLSQGWDGWRQRVEAISADHLPSELLLLQGQKRKQSRDAANPFERVILMSLTDRYWAYVYFSAVWHTMLKEKNGKRMAATAQCSDSSWALFNAWGQLKHSC